MLLYGPRQANLVLIAYASSEGSGEPPLLAHTSSESRGTFRQKARSLALLNGWACAVKICHDGMLEDTNSLGGAHIVYGIVFSFKRNVGPQFRHISRFICPVITVVPKKKFFVHAGVTPLHIIKLGS